MKPIIITATLVFSVVFSLQAQEVKTLKRQEATLHKKPVSDDESSTLTEFKKTQTKQVDEMYNNSAETLFAPLKKEGKEVNVKIVSTPPKETPTKLKSSLID